MPGHDVAVRDLAHRDVGDERAAVGGRHRRSRAVWSPRALSAVWMRQPRRRGRGQRGGETAGREQSHPVAEHARGKAVRRHDHAGVLRRLGEQRVADRREREVAQRAVGRPSARSRARRTSSGRAPGSSPSSVASQSIRARPWPSFPRRSASRKWSASTPASGSAKPSGSAGVRPPSRSADEGELLDDARPTLALAASTASAIATIARLAVASGSDQTSGSPVIGRLAQRRVERHRAEQRGAQRLRQLSATARAEHLRASCSRRRRAGACSSSAP